jgi:hypothetical protein
MAAIPVAEQTLPFYVPELASIQARHDSPFGMQFLTVSMTTLPTSSPLYGKVTTQDTEETSNDGSSKLDPVYDEDEKDDEEIPEKF